MIPRCATGALIGFLALLLAPAARVEAGYTTTWTSPTANQRIAASGTCNVKVTLKYGPGDSQSTAAYADVKNNSSGVTATRVSLTQLSRTTDANGNVTIVYQNTSVPTPAGTNA